MILLEISALYKSFTYLLTSLYCSRVALFNEDKNTWLKVQEGWLSPTERTSVSAIITKAKFGYPTRVTPVCRCLHPFAGGSIRLRQESLRHILASPGYAPGTIAVNVTWLERGFNACKTPR